ncbi:hypothetical protein RN92_03375 [Fusobacterium hwasookii ChDC F206]|uniref:GlcNAc transferase n=1 Tax=Fusobacterium hwasookii ChDC F206 TaxID=1307443 RepID=A0AAC8WIM1_9FUSO|nr:tetratricopeptide repeat protein [Fusobacterium hwasookii]ALQ34991.1 hypothetical protein RN92_03375 [Fusobacterium hwasookii ChDC F206]
MKEKLLEKIERLNELLKYQEIIDLIEALPTEQLDTELIGELGRAYNNVENYQKGLEILKSIENEEGNTALWNWRVGYSYFFLKDFISAKKCLLKAYELNPHDNTICDLLIITYANLSKLENKNGNSEKAIEYALESRKYSYDEKGIMEADSFLAWLYNKYKEYTKAEEILRKQLARNKDDKWTLSELAYSLSGQGKYEEAIEKFEYVLSLEVEDEGNLEFIYSQLGWCYRHLWKFEKALEYLNKAKEEGRNDAWINVEMALCYENLEEHEKALEYALIAYELDKNDVHVLSELGVIYGCMEKYEEALPFLLRAEELGRDDEWINTEIAINLGRSGKTSEGIKRLHKSLVMVSEEDINQRIFINSEIAWLYGRLEEPQPEEALKYLNIAKELGREDAWLYSQIGYQLGYNPEKSEEALEYFEKAIELGREDAWIFEMKGIILLDLKRYEEALNYFKKAYAKNEDGWYLYSMGECLRKLERYEEAIEVLLESRQISLAEEDEVDGEDLELAHSYLGLGDKDNAQKYLDSARNSILEQGTLNDDIKEKIEEIEEGIRSLEN